MSESVAPLEAAGGLVLKLKANSDRIEEFPQGEVQITNASNAGVPLGALEVRYYIASEYSPAQTDKLLVSVYHAQKRGLTYANVAPNQVLTDVVPLHPRVTGADAFVSIAFQRGSGQASTLLPGETVLVQFGVHPPDGDDSYYRVPRDQTNDYSFGACPQYPSTWSRVVLIVDGVLASGEPPVGVPVPGEGGAGGQGSTDFDSGPGGAGGAGGAG